MCNHDLTDEIINFDHDPLRSLPRTTKEKPFYMVYGSEPPRKIHPTFPEALSECQRLSLNHIGRKFFVLQSISVSQIEIPPVRSERLVE